MEIYTTGFTRKTAEQFFEELTSAGIRRVLDVRLRNASQLSGFTRGVDLPYFLDRLAGAKYDHPIQLAPTSELLDAYRRRQIPWDQYAERFVELIRERRVEEMLSPDEFAEPTVLLCSELKPEHCHRRLVAEYLKSRWPDINVRHL